MTSVATAVAAVADRQTAEALLNRQGTPEMVLAIALRAEQIRFIHSKRSLGVARAAVKAFGQILPELREPLLAALTWSIYGSALRSNAKFQEAQAALITAARFAASSGLRAQAEVARRFASLRADQRRPQDVQALLSICLDWGKQEGGRVYGEELVGAGSILIRINDFASATRFTEESLTYLPANGDRYHYSAIYNLANCRLELGSTQADLEEGFKLVKEAYSYVDAGTDPEFRLHWLQGKYLYRQGQVDESLNAMEMARAGINASGDGLDQALLMLDLAQLHIERGDSEAARELALSCFPTLNLLSTNPEAYGALLELHRAAQHEALDSAVIGSVRDRLDGS